MNPYWASLLYTNGRKMFISMLSKEVPDKVLLPDSALKLWDITFNAPIFNAAGMFKKAEAYYTVANQGAGAWLAGTTTYYERKGNERKNIVHPFVPYPNSQSASNWMGLPNEGHEIVAKRISRLNKIAGCPIGASISADPGLEFGYAMYGVVNGFELYDKANVDFIELNESCPNVEHDQHICDGLDENLMHRLEVISKEFLKKRNRNLPVIVKLSVDTDIKLIQPLIDALIGLGFDGINLGNTSVDYDFCRSYLDDKDKANFDYFINTFGGGVSGNALKQKSLNIAGSAVNYVNSKSLSKEFHVIRTGGVETAKDIEESKLEGIRMNQWFTGYFEGFSRHGHSLYQNVLSLDSNMESSRY
jgi:dihydroorotate dehydrogenase